MHLAAVDLGFESQGVLLFTVNPPETTYRDEAARVALFEEIENRTATGMALVQCGAAYRRLGAYEEAAEAVRQGIALLEPLGLYRLLGLARHESGILLAARGRLEEALTEDFVDWSSAVNIIRNRGGEGPNVVNAVTFTSRAEFSANHGKQPNIPFDTLNVFHGCNSTSVRWQTLRSGNGQVNEQAAIVSDPFTTSSKHPKH